MYNQERTETVTNTPQDFVKIMILNSFNYVIQSIEQYNTDRNKGINSNTAYIKSRMLSLFNILYGTLKRDYSAKEMAQLKAEVDSFKYEELMKAFYFLNEYLDKKQLTRIDNRRQYNSLIGEVENEEKEL